MTKSTTTRASDAFQVVVPLRRGAFHIPRWHGGGMIVVGPRGEALAVPFARALVHVVVRVRHLCRAATVVIPPVRVGDRGAPRLAFEVAIARRSRGSRGTR